jgi:Bacterial type III secretion protein (HrpB7)
MTAVATWKSLRKVKKFRLDQFLREADQAKAHEAQCKKQEEETRERENECRQIENIHNDKLIKLASSGQFRVDDYITMTMIGESLSHETKNAQKATTQAESATQHAHGQVLVALKVVQRAEEQLERVQEQLAKAMAQELAEQDDAQDEESEETSVARMLAHTRQEKKLQEAAEQSLGTY